MDEAFADNLMAEIFAHGVYEISVHTIDDDSVHEMFVYDSVAEIFCFIILWIQGGFKIRQWFNWLMIQYM